MRNKKIRLINFEVVLSCACVLLAGCNNEAAASSVAPASSEEETYNIVRPEFDGDYLTYDIGQDPKGFNLTYYNGVYSRGFSWLTDNTVEETELYLVKSDKGEQADFSGAELINGVTQEFVSKTNGTVSFTDSDIPDGKGSSSSMELTLNSHKVHVENLEKGKAYSYKVGAPDHYYYGAFVVEKEHPSSITAIELSDAQTIEPDKLNVWRNTFTKAVDTAGNDLDMVLYNGDQFDQNMRTVSGISPSKPQRLQAYVKALDVINDYKINLAYMAAAGNHEPSAAYSQYITSDIDYAGFTKEGCYYSYDYEYAHFTVLDSNTIRSSTAQLDWLKEDLDNAANTKWKVVMIHHSPYTTGDHSNKSETHTIIEKLAPIFSEKHVDLVLEAHDHTYSKTLPYRWDAAGYTTSFDDDDVVNLTPTKETVDQVAYDKNPNGTYYVITGAAGHRHGAREAEDGIWAECVVEDGEMKGLDPNNTFVNNKYKTVLGTLTQDNEYEPYTVNGHTSDQHYEIGDPATGNVNAAMFGVLTLKENTLSYHVYTVNDEEVKLFDTLDVMKA